MEEIRNHHVLCQRFGSAYSNDWLPHIQGLETLRSALALSPCSFFSDIVEQRDNVPQTAVIQSVHPPLSQIALGLGPVWLYRH